jgi:hypothetical protein
MMILTLLAVNLGPVDFEQDLMRRYPLLRHFSGS